MAPSKRTHSKSKKSWFGRHGHQEQETGWSYFIYSKESGNEQEVETGTKIPQMHVCSDIIFSVPLNILQLSQAVPPANRHLWRNLFVGTAVIASGFGSSKLAFESTSTIIKIFETKLNLPFPCHSDYTNNRLITSDSRFLWQS